MTLRKFVEALGWGGVALLKHTADGVAVAATVVITLRIDIRSIDVEVVHNDIIVPRSRPEVAVDPLMVRGATAEGAGERRTQGGLEVYVVATICCVKCLVFAT